MTMEPVGREKKLLFGYDQERRSIVAYMAWADDIMRDDITGVAFARNPAISMYISREEFVPWLESIIDWARGLP